MVEAYSQPRSNIWCGCTGAAEEQRQARAHAHLRVERDRQQAAGGAHAQHAAAEVQRVHHTVRAQRVQLHCARGRSVKTGAGAVIAAPAARPARLIIHARQRVDLYSESAYDGKPCNVGFRRVQSEAVDKIVVTCTRGEATCAGWGPSTGTMARQGRTPYSGVPGASSFWGSGSASRNLHTRWT